MEDIRISLAGDKLPILRKGFLKKSLNILALSLCFTVMSMNQYMSMANIKAFRGALYFKEVKGKRSLPHTQLKDFKKFVENFKQDIVQKWIDYFILHKSIPCIKIEGKVK